MGVMLLSVGVIHLSVNVHVYTMYGREEGGGRHGGVRDEGGPLMIIISHNFFTSCHSECEGTKYPSGSAVHPAGLNQRYHMGTTFLLSHMCC